VLTQVVKNSAGTVLTTVSMTYDTLSGRLKTVAETGKNTTTRTYDTFGRLATYSDGEGNTITYGYDQANNLISLKYPGPAGTNYTVLYTYDAENRLVSQQTKNALIPLLGATPGGARPLTITYTYDYLNRRAGKKVWEKVDNNWGSRTGSGLSFCYPT